MTQQAGFFISIYQGGSGASARAEINQGELISYTAKADEQGIRDLLRHYATIAITANLSSSQKRDTLASDAARGLIAANDDVITIRGRIGIAEEQTGNALTRLDAQKTVATNAYNDLVGRDQFEAAALLQQLESQLQASFVLSSRISQLSLINFI